MSKYPSIHDIVVTSCGGEWDTKSGGILNVLYKIDFELVQRLLTYDANELATIPIDIRGLRSYRVHSIDKGSIGANEWHKIRNELVFALAGSFKWTCQDVYGGQIELIVDGNTAVFTPNHILHTYEALEDGTSIAVVANTLFYPDHPETHDTFPRDILPSL